MRKAIESFTDTSDETKALKALRGSPDRKERREEESDLWDAVTIKSITRMVATAKAHTLLFLILSVQVHLLGGRLFEEQMRSSQTTSSTTLSVGMDSIASDRMTSYQASHRLVLTRTYDFFFENGLRLLVQSVERAVLSVMEDLRWDVMKPTSMAITEQAFDDAVYKIRETLEGRTRRSSRSRSVLRYLLPPDHAAQGSVGVPDELAQSILDETWDLLESPVFEDAHRDCLEETFKIMKRTGWSKLFGKPDESTVGDSATPAAATEQATRPLARIVTKLKVASGTFYKRDTKERHDQATLRTQQDHHQQQQQLQPMEVCNEYMGSLQLLPSVLELGSVSFN